MRARHWMSGLALAGTLGASGTALPQTARPGPTWAEFKQLEAEVREQRQLLIQIMQTEQQRYDMLLRLVQSNGSAPPPAAPAPAASVPETEKRASVAAAPKVVEHGERFGIVEGKVNVPGGDTGELYVYVENYKGPLTKGRPIEIKQENKQFIPQVAVVPVGTTVTFPNLDPIFHNVFSNSPRNSFDLGSYRAGDKARSAVFNAPGVVDIYCNMHQRMSAHVLVVPSKLFTRVRPDGGYRLDGVPTGNRVVVAWSPSLKPSQQKVDVEPGATARANFSLEYTDHNAHANKFGQPYGSYKD